MNSYPIDFVVPWVDDNDPVWREKKERHTGAQKQEGAVDARYRDWGTLKYWFRGVEKFAPWVRNVYFVTDDQKPEWLNLDHPKLKWVKHTDFIPSEYLPTFNTNAIEWNLHRIAELSEHFVYFNDDVFLINRTDPEDFFVDGVPCDCPQIVSLNSQSYFLHMMINNYLLMKRHFTIKESLKKNPLPWLKAQKTASFIRLLLGGTADKLLRVKDWHIQISYNKSSFETLWNAEYDAINNTCYHKTRTAEDVTSWCVREWQIYTNQFCFKKPIGQYFCTCDIERDGRVLEYITKQKGKTICLNDTENEKDFALHKQLMIEAFERILPEKSSYEL